MNCSVTDLRSKEVIDVDTGCRIGCVYDVEVNSDNGCVVAIIIFQGHGFWGFCGRGEERRIPWRDIVVIGDDSILVKLCK